MITIFIDGACEPHNPGGAMAWSLVVKNNGNTMYSEAWFAPKRDVNTNNIAEYRGANNALKWIWDNKLLDEEIVIHSDSQMMVRQLHRGKRYRIKGGGYASLAYACRKLVDERFVNVDFVWVPREENQEADRLCREILEKHNISIRVR